MTKDIFRGLNAEQAEAVETSRGPVCILAGAGSGKTTTITRRIAFAIREGVFSPDQVLAVTFTDKAAKEMAERLSRLGAPSVRARTFHSEALAQYRRLSAETEEILGSKIPVLKSLVAALPPPHRFVSVRDVATEIEWAKNKRIRPGAYLDSVSGHVPPLEAEQMAGVYAGYERRKQRAKLLDFEDLLERTIQLLSDNGSAAEQVRDTYLSFTVDEYQDVNLLQQSLLDVWLGGRSDICVVGDDYQSIYSFTGADPRYLLGFSERYGGCKSIRLTTNYRSTPEILASANRLVPHLKGSSKSLRPTLPPGAPVRLHRFEDAAAEAAWIVETIKRLHSRGLDWDKMAVLYRINARSEPYEEAFSGAGVPYQVADSPFLRRPAARALLAKLRRSTGGDVASVVEQVARALGFTPEVPAEAQGEEATRLADLERLVLLARDYSPNGGVAAFVEELSARFSDEGHGRGVQLLSLHKSKGKEYEAVFLPRLEERELPFALAATPERLEEERRLFYVGITRAKRLLFLSYAVNREGERPSKREPSRFLREMSLVAPRENAGPAIRGPNGAVPARVPQSGSAGYPGAPPALVSALKEWRKKVFTERGVPAYIIFWDSTLAAIAEKRPANMAELLAVSGVGPSKAEAFGEEVLAVVRAFEEA